MSFVPLGFLQGTNHCYIFNVRMYDCIKREQFYTLICRDEYEDFMECKSARRHVLLLLNLEDV